MTTADARFEAIIADFRARLEARVAGGSRRHDTHISAVILAGSHAWKFKKPVDFGFVDFTTLERRRHFCDREIELNRRFAPTLYEGVEAVTAADDAGVVEYAVRMRRFEAAATLDQLVSADAVEADEIAAFARELAAIHAGLAAVDPGSPYGQAALACQQILAATAAPLDAELPPRFAVQLAATVEGLRDELAARKSAGHVRDCHGDLHLTNIVRFEGRLVAFDCIEFNDELRIIDTLSDAAFLLMDLDHYGAGSLANAFFNHYIEASGDHAGLQVLPLYLAYRSLIRAKVALLGETRDGRG
ncbi:MAG: phosphotransferase, partial [Gammaproteobacteria bacterium]